METNGSSAVDLAAVQGALGITALAARLSLLEAAGPQVTALTPLKAKLTARTSATLFINGDSTAYSDHGPYYKWLTTLGQRMNVTVVLYRWAEWSGVSATGPKAYAAPVTLNVGGAGAATLTVYLAALPESVAGQMFDASRAAALAIPTPDLIIWHHGHNQQSFEQPVGAEYAQGAGTFIGPIGLMSMKWPLVPQAICNQNPWRDNSGMDRVRTAIDNVIASLANITLLNTFDAFVRAGKSSALYRDNMHPSDTGDNSAGADVIASMLMAYWERAASSGAFQTPDWTSAAGTNLLANGRFADWTAALPTSITLVNNATLTKNTTNVVDGAAWSAEARCNTPIGNQNSGISLMPAAGRAAVASKTITIAILVTVDPDQRRPFGSLVCYAAGARRTIAVGGLLGVTEGKVWLVLHNVSVEAATAGDANSGLRVYPAFSGAAPLNNDPLIIHKFVVVEGSAPKGQIAP